jgi:hypothetical protein
MQLIISGVGVEAALSYSFVFNLKFLNMYLSVVFSTILMFWLCKYFPVIH